MERALKILAVLFVSLATGLIGYHWVTRWHGEEIQHARNQEREIQRQYISQLEAELQKRVEEAKLQTALPERVDLTDVFGSQKPMSLIENRIDDCDKIAIQRASFFQYLNSKGYLNRLGMKMSAEDFFEEIFKKLAANPPTNSGELNDLYTLVSNVTHFYRLLGKDRIDVIKEIINNESAVLEPALALMVAGMTSCSTGNSGYPDSDQLDALYQYACFFLNTLGGRSYLLRRESGARMMVNYYSIMIVDMANDAELNSYGIDIRPHIDYVFYDMSNQKGIMHRQRYLAHLMAMKNKYP